MAHYVLIIDFYFLLFGLYCNKKFERIDFIESLLSVQSRKKSMHVTHIEIIQSVMNQASTNSTENLTCILLCNRHYRSVGIVFWLAMSEGHLIFSHSLSHIANSIRRSCRFFISVLRG